MEKYDDEWLDDVYLRGVFERAVKRVSKDWPETREKQWTLKKLKGELRMVNARIANAAPGSAEIR